MFDEKILNDLRDVKRELIDIENHIEKSYVRLCELADVKEMKIDLGVECSYQKKLLTLYFITLDSFLVMYDEFKNGCLNINKERYDIINRIISKDLLDFVIYVFDKIEHMQYLLDFVIDCERGVELYKVYLDELYLSQEKYITLDCLNKKCQSDFVD